jgi:hypothetical protein
MTDSNSPIDPPQPEYEPQPASDPPPLVRVLRPRPWLFRVWSEHNPFYLLSALCMLASCLALTNSLSWIPIARTRLLTLIVTLNVYEAALLGIALFLVTRRRLVYDGKVLLLLQAFFLADFTFLSSELATADLATGLLVNAALLALAALKLGLVVRVLRPNFTRGQFAFVLVELAVLFMLPCVLRWYESLHHTIGARHLYLAWWVVALLPALYEVVAWLDRRRGPAPGGPGVGASAAPTTAYLAIPYLSLLTHLGILHYVYDTSFYGAHAAPFLLGLTLILNRVRPTGLIPRKDLLALRLLLPLAAVLVSANNPWNFALPGVAWPRLAISPLGLALAGAYLVYVYCFLWRHARLFLASGAVAAVTCVVGPSRRQIGDARSTAWNWTSTIADRVIPKTLADWGILGLVASFAFLGIGFWVSLRKRPTDAPPEDGSAGLKAEG